MKTLADPAVAASLAARLQRVTPNQARVWGTITPHQMLAHVADAAEAAAARRPFKSPTRKPNRLLKWIVVYGPFTWPRGIRSGADPASMVLAPETFEAERARAVAAIAGLAGGSSFAAAHPILGPMSKEDWLRWGFLHADHHLRQFGL